MEQSRWFAVGLSLVAVAGPAFAQDRPSQTPILRIEAGMHLSSVKRIDVDRNCSLLVSGADDKTARLWSIPAGGGEPQLLRTLRQPIGDGEVGQVYAVAIAPDGKLVAVGGWSGRGDVYLFDPGTGDVVTRLGPLKNVVNHLVFSRDGRHLAATLGAGGVVAWERQGLAEWRKVLEDADFGGKDSYGADFAPDGRLFVVGDDGSLRRFSRSFKREAKVKTRGGSEPYSVAVHPDGKSVAVGIDDHMAVGIYDAETLGLVHTVDTSALGNGNVSSVAWSSDGTRLYAAGTYNEDGRYPIMVWADRGRGARTAIGVASNTIRSVLPCRDRIAFGSSDPGIGLLDAGDRPSAWVGGVAPVMRKKRDDAFTVSSDGTRVRFGLGMGAADPVVFDLLAGQLRADGGNDALARPRIDGLEIQNWSDEQDPTLRGKPIKLATYEKSRSLAIAPDGGRFVLGTDWYVRAFDRQGKELWKRPVPSVAWGVNITGNGRLVVVAFGDGTLRWLRLDDGREVLAMFVSAKDRRWIAWTPKGYYDASEGGDDLIGWHQNRGWSEAATFSFAHQRRDEYRRPEIVRGALGARK